MMKIFLEGEIVEIVSVNKSVGVLGAWASEVFDKSSTAFWA